MRGLIVLFSFFHCWRPILLKGVRTVKLHPSSALSRSFVSLCLLKVSTLTATAFLALVCLGVRLPRDAEAASTPSALAFSSSSMPPGYSSTILHVKLRKGRERSALTALLPFDLQTSIATMTPLFSLSDAALDTIKAKGERHSTQPLSDLALWRQIILHPGSNAYECIEYLRRLDSVALVEPAPLPSPPPAVTPDFTEHQGYLRPAPDGIAARSAWTLAGGNGGSVKIYDVEYSWHQTHEDLRKIHDLALLLDPGNVAVDPFRDDNHGTAILGELIADHDTKGVTGIAWGAEIGLAPANTANFGYNPANAILLAVADGAPGDVILLEQQTPVCGLPDFGPSEGIGSVFEAIHTAVANGFVVVEAAGNGEVNLDQPACGSLFDRTVRDSGAIIVGAGGSPESGYDRQRLSFSSYGRRVDVQGWGGEVMTTGYGTFFVKENEPTNPDFWYTNSMNGTSSAAAMVAGAAASLQGIALQQRGTPLPAKQIRTVLMHTGSPQVGNMAEHIGPRPDLRRASAVVRGNQPPQAKCRNVVVYADPGLCTAASASIDAGSTDPDGDRLTMEQSPPGPYGLGSTTVTLTVTDAQGATDACSAPVTVRDHQPPMLETVTATPHTLWPPNHKMVPVTVSASAADTCDPAPGCAIAAVSSNELGKRKKKGEKAHDWQITGDLTVNLRAERAGSGHGRAYTLTVQCTDTSQNSATKAVTVSVPH